MLALAAYVQQLSKAVDSSNSSLTAFVDLIGCCPRGPVHQLWVLVLLASVRLINTVQRGYNVHILSALPPKHDPNSIS